MENNSIMGIAERVKQLRVDAGMSQQEVAEKIHCGSRTSVANYESGARALTTDAAIEYSKLFEISTDWILKGGSGDTEYAFDETEELVLLFESLRSKALRKAAIEQLKVLKML